MYLQTFFTCQLFSIITHVQSQDDSSVLPLGWNFSQLCMSNYVCQIMYVEVAQDRRRKWNFEWTSK